MIHSMTKTKKGVATVAYKRAFT